MTEGPDAAGVPTDSLYPPERPPTRRVRWRALEYLLWTLVAAAYVALGFAYALPQDFRSSRPGYVAAALVAFLIRTFVAHIGLGLMVLALTAAAFRRWRPLIGVAPLLIFTLAPVLWSYRPRAVPRIQGEAVTVMSANLLFRNRERPKLLQEIEAARADVLLLQEFSPVWETELAATLIGHYPYYRPATRSDPFGLATCSRRPFVGEVNVALRLGNWDVPQARAVIRISGREVAWYNVHLPPPMNVAFFAEQCQAFADLLALLEREPLPIVLSGDFNFTGSTAFGAALRRLGLRDVHEIAGRGPGTTWPVLGYLRALPGIRLDHIYISSALTSTRSTTGIGAGSDHRPLVAEIGFRGDE